MYIEKIVDCVGDICPVPVIKVKKAIAETAQGQRLKVFLDNEISAQNVSRYIESLGMEHERHDEDGKIAVVTKVLQAKAEETAKTSWVVALGSDAMGSDAGLGRELMKAYIFALTQLDELPSAIVMYNRGAMLVDENSPALADLRTLMNQGVRVLVCGICVTHYSLQDTMRVGEISNMYAISELMAQTGKVVRP